MSKQLVINACTANTVSPFAHGAWRHPHNRQDEFNDLQMWIEFVKLLERGRFDALFFTDISGVYSGFKGGWDVFAREGVQLPSNDPSILLSALFSNTENLGLTFTSTMLQSHPFDFARRISTMDHLSNGRVGWNIVTNMLENAARNYGMPLTEHDERYRWADEYVDITYKLWESSWEDDAVVCDRESGVYADPTKVHKIHHQSERYEVEGPHLVSPSPQRTPVLFQAGQSPAGRNFAARHAEGIYLLAATKDSGAELIRDIRAQAAAAGRQEDDLLVLQGLNLVVGATEQEAKEKGEEIDEYLSVEALIAHMSGVMGVDLGGLDLDAPIADIADKAPGVQSVIPNIEATLPAGAVPTVADLAIWNNKSTRFTGTPEQVVKEFEDWVEVGADGFNIMSTITPDTYSDFIDMVVPLLQERGMMKRDYEEGTLREKMFPGRGPRINDRHPAAAHRPVAQQS